MLFPTRTKIYILFAFAVLLAFFSTPFFHGHGAMSEDISNVPHLIALIISPFSLCLTMFFAGKYAERRKEAPKRILLAHLAADAEILQSRFLDALSAGAADAKASPEQRAVFLKWREIASHLRLFSDRVGGFLLPRGHVYRGFAGVYDAIGIAAERALTAREKSMSCLLCDIRPANLTEWQADVMNPTVDGVKCVRTVTIRLEDVCDKEGKLLLSDPPVEIPKFPFSTPAPAHADAPHASAKEMPALDASTIPTIPDKPAVSGGPAEPQALSA